jgi:hypothetical protein
MALENHEDLQLFLEAAEKRPGERVLDVFTYRPAGTLIITNQRLIGKTGSNSGSGKPGFYQENIFYGDITRIQYLPGVPFIGSPAIQIQHRLSGGEVRDSLFQFSGGLGGFLVYRIAGSGPKQAYQLILEQYSKKQR